MSKVTLDMNTFKALASDTRLDILRALDGKKMSLKDISNATKLNKATLHEHLAKLHEAGLVKRKEREGHKWVYYKLTWKGEGLLHPENTRIVVMFSITFFSLLLAVMLIVSFAQPITIGMAETVGDSIHLFEAEDEGIPLLIRDYNYNYLGSVNDTKEKLSTDSLSSEFQSIAQARNAIGDVYLDEDIKWVEVEYGSEEFYKGFLSVPMAAEEDSENVTEWYDNTTNITMDSNDGVHRGASPMIPDLVAVVTDPTLLYSSVACLTFFDIFFTLSVWKYKKNKTTKL